MDGLQRRESTTYWLAELWSCRCALLCGDPDVANKTQGLYHDTLPQRYQEHSHWNLEVCLTPWKLISFLTWCCLACARQVVYCGVSLSLVPFITEISHSLRGFTARMPSFYHRHLSPKSYHRPRLMNEQPLFFFLFLWTYKSRYLLSMEFLSVYGLFNLAGFTSMWQLVPEFQHFYS